MAAPLPPTGTPLGFFIRAPNALGTPSPVLADNIDPKTRDFASLTVGRDPIDAQVILALTTVRNSGPSVLDVGIKPPPRKMTASLKRDLEANARQALQTLSRNGDILIRSIDLELESETDQTAQIRVQYQNRRALDARVRTESIDVPGLAEPT